MLQYNLGICLHHLLYLLPLRTMQENIRQKDFFSIRARDNLHEKVGSMPATSVCVVACIHVWSLYLGRLTVNRFPCTVYGEKIPTC
jgi:hypothetical protein